MSSSRELMERAIEVMRQSNSEPRTDGKTSPKVGAVLLKLDGTVETASRGELRHGDHAEYGLLERKNRANSLDGCTLFSTLEPCAPNSRRHPKLPCAERIVLARIKVVWVGIEDPDPTVDRKGIKFLQDAGVDVRMFDRDLQEIIRAENKQFIDEAQARAAVASRVKTREISLSTLDRVPPHSRSDDLSPDALSAFRKAATIQDQVGSLDFNRRLARFGLMKKEPGKEGKLAPTGFGLLLFGNEPRTAMPQSGLLATIHFPGGGEDIKDFDGPQVLVPEQAIGWLRDKLPNLIDRSDAHRRHANDPLFELVREGIVNALVHRDYDILGAKCQLVVTSDTVEIRSPGHPVQPITIGQMRAFDAPMLSRNPVLHYVFARMELAEERGLGLKSMKERAERAGLPRPRYTWQDPYLSLTIFRSPESASNILEPGLTSTLNEAERAAWQLLSTRGTLTTPELTSHLNIDEKKAQRIFRKLMRANLIRRVGKGPATHYEVVHEPS